MIWSPMFISFQKNCCTWLHLNVKPTVHVVKNPTVHMWRLVHKDNEDSMWRSANFSLMLGFWIFLKCWGHCMECWCILYKLVYIVWIRVCSMNIPSLFIQKIQCNKFVLIMSPSLANTNYLVVNIFVLMLTRIHGPKVLRCPSSFSCILNESIQFHEVY
jgi:hypothetical protein